VGFRRNANDLPSTREPTLGHVQHELTETKDLTSGHDDAGKS
jgi:hypothetical protein